MEDRETQTRALDPGAIASLFAIPRSAGMYRVLYDSGKHVYAGTVTPKVIAGRRARNKQARRTRQAQRRAQ